MANYGSQPDLDASLGLIFRLNDLWAKADRRALSGNLDAWELVLDRIFSNLLYREDINIELREDGTITNVGLGEKDKNIWVAIKDKIKKEKIRVFKSLRKKEKIKIEDIVERKVAKENHYKSIMVYDIWLRKFMQQLKLYLREAESNPGSALFGGAFRKTKR